MSPSCCVLVVGGSGYLGQFVVRELSRAGYEVHFTYSQHADVAQLTRAAEEEGVAKTVRAHRVSLQGTGALDRCLADIGRPVRMRP